MSTKMHQKPLTGISATSPHGEKLTFPLKHTEVKAKIDGNLSRVEVRQHFENPLTQPLEAVYVFPLPDEAAVDEMEIKIGPRTIKGDIKKRQEAKQIYQQAKRQGKTAGLLEQERDNIFTQSLANIKPGEQIDVIIRYSDRLKFEGGNYEFVFPMVVGPRFIPGNPISSTPVGSRELDTDEVPDASRITPPVVPPETRSGHDINITVEIDAGVPIKQIDSPSHRLNMGLEGQITRVKLNNSKTIPNKDLIIRYQVARENTQSSLLTQTDQRGTHFALYLIPALEYKTSQIVPKDVVFLMDTSGSQHGYPLKQCKALMNRFIEGLNPDDTFTIIDFSDVTTQLSAHPLNNTAANRQKADDYIEKLEANGGTYLLNGIRAVLNYPAAQDGRLRSIVLLTDGYIGNEDAILAEVQQNLKPGNRLYSFGVGSSVNRFFLNRLADVGRGTVQIVRYDEAPEPVADKFFKQINNPVLTNIEVKWLGSGEKPTIYPIYHPDLFAEQPLVLLGRIPVNSTGSLLINGIAAGVHGYEQVFDLGKITPSENKAIAQLWGRMKIKHLMKKMYSYETKDGVEEVTKTALDYQLLSKYTAFVAVSDDVRVDPEAETTTVNVPLEMPDGVSYELTETPISKSTQKLRRALVSPDYFSPFGNKLIQSGFIDKDQLKRALVEVRNQHRPLPLLQVLEEITDRELSPELVSQYKQHHLFELTILYGVDGINPETEAINEAEMRELIDLIINISICRQYKLLPIRRLEQEPPALVIAMVNPDDLEAVDTVKKLLRSKGLTLQRMVITQEDYDLLLQKYGYQLKAGQERSERASIESKSISSTRPDR